MDKNVAKISGKDVNTALGCSCKKRQSVCYSRLSQLFFGFEICGSGYRKKNFLVGYEHPYVLNVHMNMCCIFDAGKAGRRGVPGKLYISIQ